MHNTEQSGVDVRMRMNVIEGGPETAPGDTGERRRAVTPLRFEAVERRKENLAQAGVDVLRETLRVQEEANILDGLRSQIRAIPTRLEAAHEEGLAQGRAECAHEIHRERASVATACAIFGAERERYFAEVEVEVVSLALGIAARVLHREAQMDPLLLAASVRVALEKIAGQTGTILRVPTISADRWRALFPDGAVVEVIGDESMAPGDCVMETRVGRVELGVAVQLEEIEKGFFDLLQKRPS